MYVCFSWQRSAVFFDWLFRRTVLSLGDWHGTPNDVPSGNPARGILGIPKAKMGDLRQMA